MVRTLFYDFWGTYTFFESTPFQENNASVDFQDNTFGGFHGCALVKNAPAKAEDTGSSPVPGRSHMLWSN